jgi:hypothetical protein
LPVRQGQPAVGGAGHPVGGARGRRGPGRGPRRAAGRRPPRRSCGPRRAGGGTPPDRPAERGGRETAGPRGQRPPAGIQEQAPKQPGEHADGQAEPRAARHPALAVRGQPAPGHDAVQVRVVEEVLPLGMEHRHKPDLRPEVLGVGFVASSAERS